MDGRHTINNIALKTPAASCTMPQAAKSHDLGPGVTPMRREGPDAYKPIFSAPPACATGGEQQTVMLHRRRLYKLGATSGARESGVQTNTCTQGCCTGRATACHRRCRS
eukprot:CAMPEP_0170204864 /NCGR_PEP_ID=MMETSP0116_2-20130129/1964_1 /TAXON_ID=400756 /ORGANISM="Durinskia baltica, Strain CSIRO CS-38" /LENGTH=108 /DNA_ID=CAMNT_0010455231 /DNA_START=197 /DNA_END=519 /DNA_ORIENTATION=+